MSAPSPEEAALQDLLDAGHAEGVFPAAALWVRRGHRDTFRIFSGDAGPHTLWDVASLTKPMVVVTSLMRLVAEGSWDLDRPISVSPHRRASTRDLLAHRSGLPPWTDLASDLDAAAPGWTPGAPATHQRVRDRIAELADPGDGPYPTAYSDLGFILLGWALEAHTGSSLQALSPWRYGTTAPLAEANRCAPTGRDPYRDRILQGEVNDLNTWVLGGAAGHAGVFATLDEVGDWAADLARARDDVGSSLDPGVVREFWDLDQRAEGGTWVLGWDTPSPGASSAGAGVSPNAVGHLGFTGTSVWLDPDAGLSVTLLTNRVHLGEGSQEAIKAFRPRLHEGVRAILAP